MIPLLYWERKKKKELKLILKKEFPWFYGTFFYTHIHNHGELIHSSELGYQVKNIKKLEEGVCYIGDGPYFGRIHRDISKMYPKLESNSSTTSLITINNNYGQFQVQIERYHSN